VASSATAVDFAARAWCGVNATFALSVRHAQVCIERGLCLFRDGFLSECHDYMVKALRLQLGAWGDLENGTESIDRESPAIRDQALVALERSGYRGIARLRAAAAAGEAAPPAALADTSSPDFDWLWFEVERLTRFSARHALTPRERKRRRVRRSLLLAALVVLVVLICYRLWGRPRALASAIYSDNYAAKNAVDGLEATEWLLPDASLGWVDIVLPVARRVHGIRLVNARNNYHADRAAGAVHVTAFNERGRAASVDGAFAAFSETRSTLDLPLEARDVTRIRVEILSYFKSGGGLAEIEIN
jgi:hypothetical protein